jgi:DNA-binding NarL/FixJ family response regulator
MPLRPRLYANRCNGDCAVHRTSRMRSIVFWGVGVELRVLLVEDQQRMRVLLTDLFASIGGLRVVGAASTEAEAKLWLDEHPAEWDLAVIDLVLDQGAGMEVIRRCNAAPTGGKVVVFSSYATPGVRQHCMNLGAHAVFDKGQTAEFIAWIGDLTGQENAGP